MSDKSLKKSFFITTISMLMAIVVLGSSTYAWFTNNTKVGTDTVSGKTGTATLALLIGPDEGSMISSTTEGVEIQTVNSNTERILYPVSTSNLDKFYYCTSFKDGKTDQFAEDSEEKRLYHGRVYIKLESENAPVSEKYKLYLDSSENTGGVIGIDSEGYMLNAARLGIKIEGLEPVILRFAENGKIATAKNNTRVGTTELEDGYVLDSTTSYTQDPSVEIGKVTLDSSSETIEVPENSLGSIDVNTVYPVDIYFYLEGCDQDCVNEISLKECEMHIALYAIAE